MDDSRRGGSARSFVDLPRDVAHDILRRVGVVEVLTSAQYVSTGWRGICRDPSMWRHVDMRIDLEQFKRRMDFDGLCRLAVELSKGGLVGIGIHFFADDDLLLYIAERSSQLKRLQLAYCCKISDVVLASVAAMIPLLEELELSCWWVSGETIKAFGRRCPLLKTLKLNRRRKMTESEPHDNEQARAIAENMPGLVELQITGNLMSDAGLEAIIDACPHLESLDLRECLNLDFRGQLREDMCAERIKNLWLPFDSLYDSMSLD